MGQRTCSVEGCDRKHYGSNLCNLHYQRLRKTGLIGDASTLKFSADVPLQQRLETVGWDITADGCWEWRGGRTDYGYGILRVGSEMHVHRHMYRLHVGPIPAGLVIRHSCDNPPCCNPDHLQLGTVAENVADKMRRGRSTSYKDSGRTVCRSGRHDITAQGALATRHRNGREYQSCVGCLREAEQRRPRNRTGEN